MANTTDKAYTAGLIDGEGSIRIGRNLQKKRGHSIQYFVEVIVGMTDYDILIYLQQIWGGSICKKKSIPGYKEQWMWSIKSAQARTMLNAIYPYLIGKKKQAGVALEFELQPRAVRLTDDILKTRHGLYLRLMELKRG